MSKIDDMILFARVVEKGSLAEAGRSLGLSPASMTARIKALETRYQTRLLYRSTRKLSLSEAGAHFYKSCQRVADEMAYAESQFDERGGALGGSLRISAPSDFGRQHVAPALAGFCSLHPEVRAYLNLTDGLVDLIGGGYDLAVRYGNLPDSSLVMRPLDRQNRRVLCAAPGYLEQAGMPAEPQNLAGHRCLILEHLGRAQDVWFFEDPAVQAGERKAALCEIKVPVSMVSNDGAQVRQWALSGCGIALKAWRDVADDLEAGRLCPVLADYPVRLERGGPETVGLQMIYPSRRFQPRQVRQFVTYLEGRLTGEKAG